MLTSKSFCNAVQAKQNISLRVLIAAGEGFHSKHASLC